MPPRRSRRTSPVVIIAIVISAMLLVDRIWRANTRPANPMPFLGTEMDVTEIRKIHLSPGGSYTATDIEANGRQTPYQKYPNFVARHNVRTQPGDVLCPITRTEASPTCTWIVAGQEYQFCCPPCIDEFVRLAKQNPEQLQPPEFYVKRE